MKPKRKRRKIVNGVLLQPEASAKPSGHIYFEPKPKQENDDGFKGFWYTDKETGQPAHTWDYEESIGE